MMIVREEKVQRYNHKGATNRFPTHVQGVHTYPKIAFISRECSKVPCMWEVIHQL